MLKRGRLGALVLGACISLAAAAAVAADEPKHGTTPIGDMTDAEQEAAIAAGRDEFEARYEAWLAAFTASGRDPRTLPQAALMASYPPPPEDLRTAVDEAALIVIGTSRAISFEPMAGASVTFEVERVLKGSAGESVNIGQGGGPMPDPDWGLDTGTLAYAESDPLLLPGDRALLFLDVAGDGTYYVQSFTGMYRLDAGLVAALDMNPFGAEVDGSREDAFVARILEIAATD